MKLRSCYCFKFCFIWRSYTLKWIHTISPRKWISAALKPASRTHKLAWRPCEVWPQGISENLASSSFPSFTLLWLSGLPAAPRALSSHPHSGPCCSHHLGSSARSLTALRFFIQTSAQMSLRELSSRSPSKSISLHWPLPLLICSVLCTTCALQLPTLLLMVPLTRQ